MNTMTDYMKKKALSASLGIATETFPTDVYIAAYTTATTDAGGGTEVAGGGYKRQLIKFSTPTLSGESAKTSNVTDIEFPTATAGWGTITHIALLDAETGGNMLYHGAVTNPKTIEAGDRLRVIPGDMNVYLK
jgi:hypothetical protein